MDELKPCPFCGEIPRITHSSSGYTPINIECGTVYCFLHSGSALAYNTEEEAIEEWNTRKEGIDG